MALGLKYTWMENKKQEPGTMIYIKVPTITMSTMILANRIIILANRIIYRVVEFWLKTFTDLKEKYRNDLLLEINVEKYCELVVWYLSMLLNKIYS